MLILNETRIKSTAFNDLDYAVNCTMQQRIFMLL